METILLGCFLGTLPIVVTALILWILTWIEENWQEIKQAWKDLW